jgi:hypothetical protein
MVAWCLINHSVKVITVVIISTVSDSSGPLIASGNFFFFFETRFLYIAAPGWPWDS